MLFPNKELSNVIEVDCGNAFICKAMVRISKKARRVTFKINYHLGLEIIVPQRKGVNIEQKINEYKPWISKNRELLLEIEQNKKNIDEYPTTLDLKGLGEIWNIIYADDVKDLGEDYIAYQLICPATTMQETHTILYGWLLKRAYGLYSCILYKLTKKTGLRYTQLSLSIAKTRWGSCNSAHKIRLNVTMLFLPLELITYVILHELCHTKHLNHKKSFWQLVASYQQDYVECEKKLKEAYKSLPSWLVHMQKKSNNL